jgi:hypothetical protein
MNENNRATRHSTFNGGGQHPVQSFEPFALVLGVGLTYHISQIR